jgi:hypothetical protein
MVLPIPRQRARKESLKGQAVSFSTIIKLIWQKFVIGKELGRGHFGHTCSAKDKKGDLKGQAVAFSTIVNHN